MIETGMWYLTMQRDTSNKDYWYAQLLEVMKEQGGKSVPPTLQLGIMQSATSVKIGELILNAEDLYIAEHLLAGYTIPLTTPYVDKVTFSGSDGSYTTKDKAIKSSGLQKGDLVTVQRLSDTNMYVILERVVKAK